MSRTYPSVTNATTPRFLSMPRRRSPVTALASCPSHAASTTSPAMATLSAPKTARLSDGPALHGSATPQNDFASPIGLIRPSSAPAPPSASTTNPVGTPWDVRTCSSVGRGNRRRTVRRGASSIIRSGRLGGDGSSPYHHRRAFRSRRESKSNRAGHHRPRDRQIQSACLSDRLQFARLGIAFNTACRARLDRRQHRRLVLDRLGGIEQQILA